MSSRRRYFERAFLLLKSLSSLKLLESGCVVYGIELFSLIIISQYLGMLNAGEQSTWLFYLNNLVILFGVQLGDDDR